MAAKELNTSKRIKESERKLSDTFYYALRTINIINLIFIFIFNFLGYPILKYLILFQFLITAFATFSFPLQRALPFLIGFFFVEGQGRIVWEYNPLFRAAFDITLALGFIKSHSNPLPLIGKGRLAPWLMLLIFLHFLYYFISIASPSNYNFLSSLLTVKIFILPFLFFFYFLRSPIDLSSKDFRHSIYLLIAIIFAQHGLVIYQTLVKEDLLISISDYYMNGRGKDFVGPLFRAWGTTHYPAAISAYFALVFPLMFLYNNQKDRINVIVLRFLAVGTIPLSVYCLFLLQVRSSSLRYGLVALLVLTANFLINQNRVKRFLQVTIGSILLIIPIMTFTGDITSNLNEQQVEITLSRWTALFDDEFDSGRLDFKKFTEILSRKLNNYPFGLGPGSSFYDLSRNKETTDFRPKDIWHYENLIIAMATDFGWASVIILTLYFLFPFNLILKSLRLLIDEKITAAKSVYYLGAGILVIVVCEWFSYGLPFNPTSFMFWLYSAMGINTFYYAKFEDEIKEV